MARPKSDNPRAYRSYKLNVEVDLYGRIMKRAKESGRSFNGQVEYACLQDCGVFGNSPTIVVGDIGDMLFLPTGQYLELDERIFKRFCKRFLPPHAVQRWDADFSTLGEAAGACGNIVAVLSPGGIVLQDPELWKVLYDKYL